MGYNIQVVKNLVFVLLPFLLFIFPLKLVKAQNMEIKKTALILHGWPQPVEQGSLNYQYLTYFQNKGYDVVAPKLFTKDFVLKEPDAKNYVEKLLNGKKPDVIVGISLGGLLAPVIAKDYPDAKLIFIATDPKMQPEAPGIKIIFDLAKNINFLRMLNLLRFMPSRVLFSFYEFINPFSGSETGREIYVKDMKLNFKYMLAIPVDEEEEIINFVSNSDNTELLKTMKNKALIFSGKNDLMMPANPKNNLHSLLINSQEIISDGGHFNVIADKNFQDFDKFLAE
jgi:pimeloyl-ACP methyl ester carboxylesterase